MSELKIYGDIYDKEFLEKFGEYRDTIANTKLYKEFEVDVKKIAELCDINVDYGEIRSSGFCVNLHSVQDNESSELNNNVYVKDIKINIDEPICRQRFTIAHELGHIILGHKGISFRDSNLQYKDFILRMNEVTANSFAAELLMPEILLRQALETTMTKLNYNLNQLFFDSDIDYLVESTSKLMNVSMTTFKYRLKNLGIFVKKND